MNASALALIIVAVLVLACLGLVAIGQVEFDAIDQYVGYATVGALAIAAPKPELKSAG